MKKYDLGEILLHRGWIDRSQLNRALAIQRQIPGRLGSCLLEIDATSENQLVEALAEQMGVPAALPEDLKNVPAEVIALIPAKLAVRAQAVPFRLTGNRLSVALADTEDLALQDELSFASGKRIQVHVASEARILEALESYYGEECPARYARLLDRLNRSRYLWSSGQNRTGTGISSPAVNGRRTAPTSRSSVRFEAPRTAAVPGGPLAAAPAKLDAALPDLPELPPPLPHSSVAAEDALTMWEDPAPLPFRPRPTAPEATPASDEEPTEPGPRARTSGPSAPAAPAPEAVAAQLPPTASPAAETPSAVAEEPEPKATARAPFDYPEPPTMSLTDEERAALESSEIREDRAGEGLRGRLARRADLDAIGEELLESLRGRFQRGALLKAHGGGVRGWLGTGLGFDERLFAVFELDFEEPSAFLNLHLGSPFVVGPLAQLPAHHRFLACWHRRGGDEIPPSWLVPVRLGQRTVTFLYGEGLRKEGGVGGLATLQWLSEEAAKAFESCILRRKKQRSASASEV
ncbi:MAG: hypothetical protein KDD11_18705 [Acidobacteria bacterium]|nr:hypothetical protein [Acidobacteriota bacterium]